MISRCATGGRALLGIDDRGDAETGGINAGSATAGPGSRWPVVCSADVARAASAGTRPTPAAVSFEPAPLAAAAASSMKSGYESGNGAVNSSRNCSVDGPNCCRLWTTPYGATWLNSDEDGGGMGAAAADGGAGSALHASEKCAPVRSRRRFRKLKALAESPDTVPTGGGWITHAPDRHAEGGTEGTKKNGARERSPVEGSALELHEYVESSNQLEASNM